MSALVHGPRRVGMVLPGLGIGGAERMVVHLALDLKRRGHFVAVAATTRGGLRRAELERAGIPVTLLNLEAHDRNAFGPLPGLERAVAGLRRWMQQAELDVVHSHLSPADILVGAARCTVRRPPAWVSTVHNPGVELRRRRRWAWMASLRLGAQVVAVSQAVANSAPVGAKAVIHPSPVHLDRPLPSRASARRRGPLSTPGPLVLFVGRLAHIKGVDRLARLASALPPQWVAAIGEGPGQPELEAAGVRCLGARAAPEQLMGAADVLVLPSRSEGFPQVLLEAAAAGVPVVATDVPGTRELLGPQLAPQVPNGPEAAVDRALLQAVQDALTRPEAARAQAAALRRRVEEQGWTRPRMVDRYEELIRRGRV